MTKKEALELVENELDKLPFIHLPLLENAFEGYYRVQFALKKVEEEIQYNCDSEPMKKHTITLAAHVLKLLIDLF